MEPEKIIKTVFDAKPKLLELTETHGGTSYLTYLDIILPTLIHTRDTAMDALFFKAWSTLMRQYFDARLATEIMDELKKNFFASTADHGGALCHPFFANAFFARAQHTLAHNHELVLTLPCAGVSLDNSSFPRGLFFHDNNLEVVRLHFKSLSERHDSVYSTTPYTNEDISRVENEIQNAEISNDQKRILTSLVKDIFDRHDQYERATYDEQMIRANWLLPKYVKGYEHIEHISISQEMLVRELLHLHLDTDSFVAKLLLDSSVQKMYEEMFDGIIGAHTKNTEKGTHLFWGLDQGGVRLQLCNGEDGWYTEDGALFLSHDKEAIKNALRERKVYPSMALTFIVLSFVHKLTTGGGFSQINYQGDMRDAFEKLVRANNHEAGVFPETNIFTGELVVNVLEKDGQSVPATLIDTVLYQEDTTSLQLKNAYTTATLKDAIWSMMPEYYKIVTGTTVEQTHFSLPPATLHVKRDTSL